MGSGIGASVLRVEDQRFITGTGTYTDDIQRPGQSHAYIVRATTAHGIIKKVDVSHALSAPGVIAAYNGADLQADKIGILPCGWMTMNIDGTPMFSPTMPVVAHDRVRYVGEPIAVVIAESVHQAKDAAELIEIEIDDLPAVASIERAIAPGGAMWVFTGTSAQKRLSPPLLHARHTSPRWTSSIAALFVIPWNRAPCARSLMSARVSSLCIFRHKIHTCNAFCLPPPHSVFQSTRSA